MGGAMNPKGSQDRWPKVERSDTSGNRQSRSRPRSGAERIVYNPLTLARLWSAAFFFRHIGGGALLTLGYWGFEPFGFGWFEPPYVGCYEGSGALRAAR